eukprot:6008646-Alexandrium_andersonii.AAC.1
MCIRDRRSRRLGLKSADPMAEVLQLLVDGVVEVLQLLVKREHLGLEAFGNCGLLSLGLSDALKLPGAGSKSASIADLVSLTELPRA